MNHTYKLIWSVATNSWIACSGLAKRGKTKSLKIILAIGGLTIGFLTFAAECAKGSQGG